MKGWMYILKCADDSYYTGSTNNLELRISQHQNGEGANHTAKRLPVALVYFEKFDRIDEAFYREKQVQGWSRKKKEALIERMPEKLHELSRCLNETSHVGFGSAQPTATPTPKQDLDKSENNPVNEQKQFTNPVIGRNQIVNPVVERSRNDLLRLKSMSEWKETDFGRIPGHWDLKKIIDIKSDDRRAIAMGPFGSNIKAENFVEKGVPVIRGTNLNYAKYVDGDFVFLTEEKADELIGSNCKVGDLVFTHRGTIGQVGLVPPNKYSRYVISQSGMKLTVNPDVVNNEFLFYFFKSDFGQYQILKYEAQVGVPSISNPLTSLKEMQVPIPPLSEQTAIASVLSSLDDKIDLLHRQNATLEKMAETLFRQWFVHRPEPVEGEEAKEGWGLDTLGNVFDIGIGRTPPRKEHHWFSENPSDVKWVSIKDMGTSGVYISTVSEYLTQDAVNRFSIPIIPENTVLLSFKMTIGRLAISTESMLSNEAIAHFKVKRDSKLFSEFLYLYLKTYQWEQLGSTSSIVEAINSQMIKDMEILIPDEILLIEFKEVIEPYFKKIKSNQTQIRTLTALRDNLLPKLMSGEVRVEMN